MKRKLLHNGFYSLLLGMLLSGCGGGSNSPSSTPVALKFRTYSAAVGAPGLKQVDFRMLLPQGVSVAEDANNPGLVDRKALKLTGIFTQSPFKSYTSSAYLYGSYSSAKPAGSGRDAIMVNLTIPSNSFPTGEFLTVSCSAVPGSLTTKDQFSLIGAPELGGDSSGGLAVDLTSQYKFDFSVH